MILHVKFKILAGHFAEQKAFKFTLLQTLRLDINIDLDFVFI